MFLGVLFIIANTWRQPGGPPIGGWVDQYADVHSDNGIFSVLKRNELQSHGENLNEYYGVKEVNLKRLPTIASYVIWK